MSSQKPVRHIRADSRHLVSLGNAKERMSIVEYNIITKGHPTTKIKQSCQNMMK